MKVLYANTTLPPLHFGGSEVYCMGLAKTMPRFGVETAAVCIESWGDGDHRTQFRRAETYDGVRIHRLYSNEQWEPVSTLWTGSNFYVQQFEQILDEEKPDLIHVMAHLRLAKLFELARKRGIPVVVTGVDFSPICGRSSLVRWDNDLCDGKAELEKCRDCLAFSRGLNPHHWHGRAERAWNAVSWLGEDTRDRVYRTAASFKHNGMGRVRFYDEWGHRTAQRIIGHIPELFGSISRVFAPSPIMHEMWEKNGYPAEQIVDFPYGVDIQGPPIGRYKTHANQFRFGFIGRFNGLKNLRTLLEAFLLIDGTVPISLSLYGAEDFWDHGNEEIQGLKKMVESCPNIHFKGRLDRSQISEAYQEIDCLVVPSVWYENAPISMMEAQYLSTPIICTDLPGMTCLVEHELNGLLFRSKSARGLALQMYRIASEPELYERLRANSISIQPMAENAKDMLAHYLDVTGKTASDLLPECSPGGSLSKSSSNGHLPENGLETADGALLAELMDYEGESADFSNMLGPLLRRALEDFSVQSLKVLELTSGTSTTLGWAVSEGICRVKSVSSADQLPALADPLSGETYHLAVATGICQAEDPVSAFHQVAGVLKPGGYVCLLHPLETETDSEPSAVPAWQMWNNFQILYAGNSSGKVWRLDQGLGLETLILDTLTADGGRSWLRAVYRKPALSPGRIAAHTGQSSIIA